MAASYTLASLRTAILRRVDHETTGYFVSSELDQLINDSLQRHHDLMISVLGQEYSLAELVETVEAGEIDHALPDDFYKPVAIYAYTDIGWVPMLRFEFQDRLLQLTPMLPDWMPRLHLMGLSSGARQLKIDPPASAKFNIKHVYHTAAPVLDDDADELIIPYPELLILDVAVKCQQRQRKDAAELIAERTLLRTDIEAMHAPEDRANPPTVIDITSRPYWPYSLKFDASLLPEETFESIKIRASVPQSIPHLGPTTQLVLDVLEFDNATSMAVSGNFISLQKTGYYLIEWEAYWEEASGSGVPGPKFTRPTFNSDSTEDPMLLKTVAGGDKSFGKSALVQITSKPMLIGLQAYQEDTLATFDPHLVQCALAVTRLGDL